MENNNLYTVCIWDDELGWCFLKWCYSLEEATEYITDDRKTSIEKMKYAIEVSENVPDGKSIDFIVIE